jgi:hypothetical protein
MARHAQQSSSVALLAPPVTVSPEPAISQKLSPLDGLVLQPARPLCSETAQPVLTPVPVRISSPASPAATLPCVEFTIQPAGPVPPGEIGFHAAQCATSSLPGQPAQPLPPRRQSIAFMRAELPAAHRGGMAVGDLTQIDAAPLKPRASYRNGQPKAGVSTPLSYKQSKPSLLGSGIKLSGESLGELLKALKESAEELDRAAIHAIHASFYQQSALALLPAPVEIVTPPAPPAAQWMRSGNPKFSPIAPERVGRTTTAGPQWPTLAGPRLPPELVHLEHRNSGSRRQRKPVSAWPISLLVATVLILGGGSLLQRLSQDRDGKAASAPVTSTTAAAAPGVRVLEEHPAARSVEVAGIRIVMGPGKQPQLQYVVINHSASEITGLNIRVAVRSVESVSADPLCSVSSLVASLGPNQSKEIHANLDPSVAPSAVPDWHSLRTEVLVGRQ